MAHLLEKELAYLQNPSTAERPVRSWARHSPLTPRSKALALAVRCGMFVAVAASLVVAVGWAFWPGEKVQNAAEPVSSHAAVSAGPAPVLWDADGTAEFSKRVHMLGEEMRQPTQSQPLTDPWDENIGEVRRRLSALSESHSW